MCAFFLLLDHFSTLTYKIKIDRLAALNSFDFTEYVAFDYNSHKCNIVYIILAKIYNFDNKIKIILEIQFIALISVVDKVSNKDQQYFA